jgi:hypothetical protein
METALEWARGPVFWFAIAFMVLGLVRHVLLTLWEVGRAYYKAGDKNFPYAQVIKNTWQWLLPIGKFRERTSYGVVTFLFHAAIVLTPILLGGHIVLIQRGTGLSWPAIPNALADVLTILAVLMCVVLVVQRAVRPDSRAVSKFSDYAIPVCIALPFASGFLVMHPGLNPFPFTPTLFLHVMSANLVLILIPVTKISHCILTPTSQVVAQMAWHWPSDAGSKLAVTLNKENEPV